MILNIRKNNFAQVLGSSAAFLVIADILFLKNSEWLGNLGILMAIVAIILNLSSTKNEVRKAQKNRLLWVLFGIIVFAIYFYQRFGNMILESWQK